MTFCPLPPTVVNTVFDSGGPSDFGLILASSPKLENAKKLKLSMLENVVYCKPNILPLGNRKCWPFGKSKVVGELGSYGFQNMNKVKDKRNY
jgi:hypothetical protein